MREKNRVKQKDKPENEVYKGVKKKKGNMPFSWKALRPVKRQVVASEVLYFLRAVTSHSSLGVPQATAVCFYTFCVFCNCVCVHCVF